MGKKIKAAKMPIRKILQNRTARAGFAFGCFSTCLSILAVGLSMTGYINHTLGWVLTGIGLVGMAVSSIVFLSSRNSIYKALLIKEKGVDLRQIPDTLTAMFQRIREIRAEQAKRNMDTQTAKRIQANMEDISPLPWWVKRITHYLQKINEPKLFEKWVANSYRKFVGTAYNKRCESHICNIGGVLETEGFGLRQVMAGDREYKPLSEKLERQYAGIPENIRKPILRYENYLYGFSSTILWDDYRKAHLGRLLPSAVEAKITRYSQLEKEVMSKLEEDVSKAISKYMR